ncbi:MAG: hypothetical protein B7Z62_08700 [Deltaproteobacteria bacterium 37-65-8]|nr:MAG: hypothetical protein B7Z62_08700 [Deltaproteobacteria bacterium 37-65-8]
MDLQCHTHKILVLLLGLVVIACDSVNNAGITVEGSHSGQQFTTGNVGALEGEVHSMVLRLLGKDDGRPVAAPVTVKTKKKCSSCGKEWEYAIEYCGGCGTFLRQ